MTPYDLQLVIEAGQRRREHEREMTAWALSGVLSALTHQGVSMDDLLGPAWTLRRMQRERGLPEHGN